MVKGGNGFLGRCNGDIAQIEIVKGQDVFGERDTALHEAMHAILRQQGRSYCKAEEVYVTALATGVLGMLRSNPAFAQYLLEN
jgi:hypothetical protein